MCVCAACVQEPAKADMGIRFPGMGADNQKLDEMKNWMLAAVFNGRKDNPGAYKYQGCSYTKKINK